MEWAIFLGAMTALGAGCAAETARKDRMDRPLYDAPLKHLSGIGGLVIFGYAVWAYFIFPWWVPLAGFAAAAIGGGVIPTIFRRVWPLLTYIGVPSGIAAGAWALIA